MGYLTDVSDPNRGHGQEEFNVRRFGVRGHRFHHSGYKYSLFPENSDPDFTLAGPKNAEIAKINRRAEYVRTKIDDCRRELGTGVNLYLIEGNRYGQFLSGFPNGPRIEDLLDVAKAIFPEKYRVYKSLEEEQRNLLDRLRELIKS